MLEKCSKVKRVGRPESKKKSRKNDGTKAGSKYSYLGCTLLNDKYLQYSMTKSSQICMYLYMQMENLLTVVCHSSRTDMGLVGDQSKRRTNVNLKPEVCRFGT